MWDEEDGFYYDVLRLPDGSATRLKVRSMVGLLPLCATTVIEQVAAGAGTRADGGFVERLRAHAGAARESSIQPGRAISGMAERGIIALVNRDRLRRILARMLDENEFLSPYGIRALSRYHAEHPYVVYGGRRRNTGWIICRRSRTPACSAATPTGAGRSGCR